MPIRPTFTRLLEIQHAYLRFYRKIPELSTTGMKRSCIWLLQMVMWSVVNCCLMAGLM